MGVVIVIHLDRGEAPPAPRRFHLTLEIVKTAGRIGMGFNKVVALVSLCLLVFLVDACEGFSGWPDVTLSCNSMTPGHVVLTGAQSTRAPYQLLTKQNTDGTVAVAVRGNGFKGFLLQARDVDGNRVGVFKPTAADARAIRCDYEGGAIQHNNGSIKTQVVSNWNPGQFKGKMQFRLTVVKEYTKFWTNIRSEVLNLV